MKNNVNASESFNLNGTGYEDANKYFDDFWNTYDESKSQTENEIEFFHKHFPSKSYDEVEEIVSDIHDGCCRYNENLELILEGEKVSIKDAISDALSGKSIDEQYADVINLILTVHAVDSEVICTVAGENRDEAMEKIEEIIKEGVKPVYGAVSQDDLDKALDTLDEAINQTAFGYYGCEKMLGLLEDVSVEGSLTFIDGFWQNEEMKTSATLASYIAHLKGELPGTDGEVTPFEMGINVSSSIDKALTLEKVSAGEMALDAAKDMLEAVGKAAFACLMEYAVLVLGITVTSILLMLIIGTTPAVAMLGIIIGAIGGFVLVDKICKKKGWSTPTQLTEVAKEKIVDCGKATLKYVKEDVVPRVKKGVSKACDFVSKQILSRFVRGYKAFVSGGNVSIP